MGRGWLENLRRMTRIIKGEWKRELLIIKNSKNNCPVISVNTLIHIDIMKSFTSGDQMKLLSCLSENNPMNIYVPSLDCLINWFRFFDSFNTTQAFNQFSNALHICKSSSQFIIHMLTSYQYMTRLEIPHSWKS